jgi:hypothetical protein
MAQSGSRGPGGVWRELLLPSILVLSLVPTGAAAAPPAGMSPDERAAEQQQFEAATLAVTRSDQQGWIWRADNPPQGLVARFGAEDLLLVPAGHGGPDSWRLGLRLTGWGTPHDLRQIDSATATAEGNRVEYRRGPLTEWYANTPQGLEQGFTVDAPPTDDLAELVLEMTLDSDLTPALAEDGRAVSFRRTGSTTLLSYSGLEARDAVDEHLEARMELAGGGARLRLVVAVDAAAWPITVDPIFTQAVKLLPTADINAANARFGRSVAADGDLLVVGLVEDVNGADIGAAYLFQRDLGGPDAWGQLAKLTADDGIADNEFGYAVAISGDTVVIGAYGDLGVSYGSGSAYVFHRNQGGPDAWGQVAKLVPFDGHSNDFFGCAVAVNGDTAVVGALGDDDHGSRSGSAYVFRRDQGGPDAWGLVVKITPADGDEDDEFGTSAAIHGDTAIIGAPGGDGADNASGSAYVFQRDQGGPSAWGQVARIAAADGATGDDFGASVAISADTATIGAPNDDDLGWNSGSAYVFQRDQGGADAWGQVAKVTAADGAFADAFGLSVSVSGDTVVAGAWFDEVGTGASYVFERDQGGPDTWGQVAKLVASDGEQQDNFGFAVAISGDTAIAGARGDDDTGDGSGSVYLFERDQGGVSTWGQLVKLPCPNAYSARNDAFGRSVATSGDTAIVGAWNDDDMGEDSGSAYIFQRDHGGPGAWGLVAKLTAGDGAAEDLFGGSVAISGDIAIIGAEGDDSAAGSAYLFRRDQGGADAWGQVAKITADDSAAGDRFGGAVAISGDTAVVGARRDDDQGSSSGSVYVFRQDAGGADAWGQVAKVVGSDAEVGDEFGTSVAISGDVAIAGAPFDPVAYDQTGTAYVLYRDTGGPDAWGQVAKITAITGSHYERFGWSVAISGDTAVVGETNFRDSGWVFFFRRDAGGPDVWYQVMRRQAADAAPVDFFGLSVSIDGEIAVVGAPRDDHDSWYDAGSVVVFRRDQDGDDAWGQVAKLTSVDCAHGDLFGYSVSVDAGTAVIGAYLDDDLGEDSGSAYVFNVGALLFGDDFESRDTSLWAATEP